MTAITRPNAAARQRIKVGLPTDRLMLLERKATSAGETVSAYVRHLIEQDLANEPPTPFTSAAGPAHRRAKLAHTLKVGLSADTETRLSQKARQARMTNAAYVRDIIRHDLGQLDSKPVANRHHDSLLLASDVHALAIQVKKLGTNFNQMARQVNTGLVPLSRQEVQAMSRLYTVAMEKAEALFEKVLLR